MSVVIATTCESRRAAQLRRALESVLNQTGVDVEPVVVVNGTRYDARLLADLREDARLKVFCLQEPSFPAALRFGRETISGPYFSFLDDDDVYLPGALRTRYESLTAAPAVDFVCTNGYVEDGGDVRLLVSDIDLVQRDPFEAHFRFNWLGSSAALFDAAAVPASFFDGITKHFEWTWVTHQLLRAGKRSRFVDVPTFYKHDTPGSLSKDATIEPLLTELRVLELMAGDAPTALQPRVSSKMRATLHALSHFHCHHGSLREAWRFHGRSLRFAGGWRHLPYTRLLALATLRALVRPPSRAGLP